MSPRSKKEYRKWGDDRGNIRCPLPIHPESVQKYLESKFGDTLEDVSNAIVELAKSLPPAQLAEKVYALYEKFRPEIPSGKKGWGASGKLDLDLIRKMASA